MVLAARPQVARDVEVDVQQPVREGGAEPSPTRGESVTVPLVGPVQGLQGGRHRGAAVLAVRVGRLKGGKPRRGEFSVVVMEGAGRG